MITAKVKRHGESFRLTMPNRIWQEHIEQVLQESLPDLVHIMLQNHCFEQPSYLFSFWFDDNDHPCMDQLEEELFPLLQNQSIIEQEAIILDYVQERHGQLPPIVTAYKNHLCQTIIT